MDGLYLVCLALVCVPSLCWALSYTCYSDDTVKVSGLGDYITDVFAKNEDGFNCTTTAPADTVNITGCEKGKYIVFSFRSYSDMLVLGSNITAVNITCNEITATDVSINNTFAASIQFLETAIFNVTYSVTSDLSTNVATVGDDMDWTIYYPSDYKLAIHSCTANPGTSYNQSTSIELITEYCAQIPDLISNFNNGVGEATATINAFQFYGNTDVFLYCTLTVCPANDDCTISCQTTVKRQVDERESTDGRFTSHIGQVLRIIDPNANGVERLSGLSITFTILIVLTSQL